MGAYVLSMSAECIWVPGDAARNRITEYERDCEALAGGGRGEVRTDRGYLNRPRRLFPATIGEGDAASGPAGPSSVGTTLRSTNRQCTAQ